MYSSPVGINKVKITDEFWAERVDTVREKVIPYQWEILNDRVADADPSSIIYMKSPKKQKRISSGYRTICGQTGAKER